MWTSNNVYAGSHCKDLEESEIPGPMDGETTDHAWKVQEALIDHCCLDLEKLSYL